MNSWNPRIAIVRRDAIIFPWAVELSAGTIVPTIGDTTSGPKPTLDLDDFVAELRKAVDVADQLNLGEI